MPTKREQLRARRHNRVRAKVSGTATRPRLAVFKSLTSIYAQLIDDEKNITLVSADSREVKGSKDGKVGKSFAVGQLLGERAQAKGINAVVFDRGGNKYHGRIKALADGARDKGLVF